MCRQTVDSKLQQPTSAFGVRYDTEWYMRQILLSATVDQRCPIGLLGSYISATVVPLLAAAVATPEPPCVPTWVHTVNQHICVHACCLSEMMLIAR